jgi:hypothetical protein
MVGYLQQENVAFQYVVPIGTDSTSLTVSKLCALNVPLALQFLSDDLMGYGTKDNLFCAASFPDCIFLQISFQEDGNNKVEDLPKPLIKNSLYLGSDLIHLFKENNENTDLKVQNDCLTWHYTSLVDFEKGIIRHCKSVLKMIDLCRILSNDIHIGRIGRPVCSIVEMNRYQFHLVSNHNALDDFYWSVALDPKLTVSDSYHVWGEVCANEIDKSIPLHTILKVLKEFI